MPDLDQIVVSVFMYEVFVLLHNLPERVGNPNAAMEITSVP
jgi:hypothetical protein